MRAARAAAGAALLAMAWSGCLYVSAPQTGGKPRRTSWSDYRRTVSTDLGPLLEQWSHATAAAVVFKRMTGRWPETVEELASAMERLGAAPERVAWWRSLRVLELREHTDESAEYRLETKNGSTADVQVNVKIAPANAPAAAPAEDTTGPAEDTADENMNADAPATPARPR